MQQQQSVQMSTSAGEVPPGSAMVYMTRPKTYDRYKHKQSIGLGITQIIIGILCIIFNSVALGVSYSPENGLGSVGHGYWCGVLVSNLNHDSHIAIAINDWLQTALAHIGWVQFFYRHTDPCREVTKLHTCVVVTVLKNDFTVPMIMFSCANNVNVLYPSSRLDRPKLRVCLKCERILSRFKLHIVKLFEVESVEAQPADRIEII